MRRKCLYCGTKLRCIIDKPNKDTAFGGVIYACPKCEGDFIGRLCQTRQSPAPAPQWRGLVKPWSALRPTKGAQ